VSASSVAAYALAASDLPAAGGVAGLVTAFYGGRLVRHAWRVHRSQPAGPCRSAGMLGLGVLAGSLTCAGTASGYAAGASPDLLAGLAALGLLGASAAFVAGLVWLPVGASGRLARARRALDGVSVGICALFTVWVLLISPNGAVTSLGFWITVLTACVLAMAVVTALRAARAPSARTSGGPRGTVACAGAVAAAELGLGGLAFALANGYRLGWPTVSAALVAVAGVLAWSGARRGTAAPVPGPVAVRPGAPILAVPAAAAVAVALTHLVTGGDFDRPAIVLGVLGMAVVALRETLTTLDMAGYTRVMTAQVTKLHSLVAGGTDVIMVVDADLVVRWQSPAAARQLGLSDADVLGRNLLSMVHPDDAGLVGQRLVDALAGLGTGADGEPPALVEARLRDGFGLWRETESAISDQRDTPEVGGLVVHIRDVSERKEMERTLHRLAFADHLTGLANRRQTLQSITALRASEPVRGAVLLIGLSGPAGTFDPRGYDGGDAVVREVAHRLRTGADGGADLAGRITADDFAVVTRASPVEAYALATRLIAMLAEPVALAGQPVELTACVGLADLAGASDADEVLRRADLAMRRARQLGPGRVEWYDDAMKRAMQRRLTLARELPDAITEGQLDLVYQPIMDLAARRPFGVEALLRWRHPRLGTLLPAEIIPVAEETGLATALGGWVLHRAGRQLQVWLGEGRDLCLSVNVTHAQLAHPDLVADLAGLVDRYEVPADRLVVELAESQLGSDSAAVGERLARLRSVGVRTALDEFGTGPDSLAHLRRLPMDLVKIGRPFFDGSAPEHRRSLPVIDAMVGLGRRLGVDVVAQGLEDAAELDTVRAAGCRLAQGYLLAPPQPAEHAEAFLDGFPAPSR
jgi:diguanylate cyclase (GGDEF)-like protein/PAS domain S-box-containing protein